MATSRIVRDSTRDIIWELPGELWHRLEPIVMKAGRRRGDLPANLPRNGQRPGLLVIQDPHYILCPSAPDEHSRVLKQGESFAVFDHYGDIKPVGMGEEGLFHEGTRFLSCQVLRLGADRPLMLSSTVRDDNGLLTVDLTNPDIYEDNRVIVPRGTVHLLRSKFLWQGACHERLTIRNYGSSPVRLALSLHVESDFADIFEVRGTRRKKRGEYLPPAHDQNALVLAYRGLDGVVRRTRLTFAPSPQEITDSEAHFEVALPSQGETTLTFTTLCETVAAAPARLDYDTALTRAVGGFQDARRHCCDIHTSNAQFNDWINRSLADLLMMTTRTAEGPYPYAGVPWFSTPFGRDGIITALEVLWFYPAMARGVLGFLAANQATEINPVEDAEPGKILHETRRGEMAALGEIPFGRYYGSVDATPLFVLLAGEYFERTQDRAFIESIWPNVERALTWCDNHGDQDKDGFVEYFRNSPQGLQHQGWKDSHDAVFHADGAPATGPIALCEVQGYVYAAKRSAAKLAAALGNDDRARQLADQADALRNRFEQAFWCEDLSTYALALDGEKRPCRVRTSNAGQCLFSEIAAPERARRLAQTLLGQHAFSGWGIRTVAGSEVRYNPMSYHNGSIWPHDNALIGLGLSRYGLKDAALKVLTGLFDASLFMDLHRMPELFCGFPKRPGEGPTLYPVACSPQAWSAAAVFLLLQACLGLSVHDRPARVQFSHPVLPEYLHEMWIRNLRVGDATVDLYLERHPLDVGVNVLRREGDVEVVVVK